MRVTVIKDDLTGKELGESEVTVTEVMFGDYTGTFEGSEASTTAMLAVLQTWAVSAV